MSEIVPVFLPFRPIFIEIRSIKTYCQINSCYFSAHMMGWLAVLLKLKSSVLSKAYDQTLHCHADLTPVSLSRAVPAPAALVSSMILIKIYFCSSPLYSLVLILGICFPYFSIGLAFHLNLSGVF